LAAPPASRCQIRLDESAFDAATGAFWTVVHRGRSVCFLEGELRDGKGELIATASATALVLGEASPA
jgi:acyl-coenzyme A thioesterase PaaI-like protein